LDSDIVDITWFWNKALVRWLVPSLLVALPWECAMVEYTSRAIVTMIFSQLWEEGKVVKYGNVFEGMHDTKFVKIKHIM
jgi:hypothetical protein